jgi:hypothetical protein
MSPSALSIFVFGLYLVIVGFGFLVIPNTVLPMFKLPKTNEVWIRTLGMVVWVLAFYYIIAAQNELMPFFWATVVGRFGVLLILSTLVATKKGPPVLLLFGVIDALGAIWTYLSM